MIECEKCRGFGFVINGTGMPYANGQEVKVNLECLECGGSGMIEQPKQDSQPISNREALRQVAETTENLEQEIAECVANEARRLGDDKDERNFIWAYRLLLAFAKHLLATEPIGEGHRDHGWGDLVGTSQSMYMHQARRLAGIDDDEFLADIRNGLYDVGDIYEESER